MTKKYTFLTVFILFLGSLAQAQIKKGSILLGGFVRYGNYKSDEESGFKEKDRDKLFEIGPAAAIAIQDNLLVGIELGYNTLETSDKATTHDLQHKQHGYFVNAMIRKYWNITSKFYAFAHGSAGYGQAKQKGEDKAMNRDWRKGKSWALNATLVPGIAYSVSRKVQLESTFLPLLNIGYTKGTTENLVQGSKSDRETFSVSSSLINNQQFSLGIRVLLEK